MTKVSSYTLVVAVLVKSDVALAIRVGTGIVEFRNKGFIEKGRMVVSGRSCVVDNTVMAVVATVATVVVTVVAMDCVVTRTRSDGKTLRLWYITKVGVVHGEPTGGPSIASKRYATKEPPVSPML